MGLAKDKINISMLLFFVIILQSIPTGILQGADLLFIALVSLVYFETLFWSFIYTLGSAYLMFFITRHPLEIIILNYIIIPLSVNRTVNQFSFTTNKWFLLMLTVLPLYIFINLANANHLDFNNFCTYFLQNLFVLLIVFSGLKVKLNRPITGLS